ncbi:unnamed protein product [Rotaria socialis]|uniref:Uncharacterized protein n=1 Tax=Rotaria socialis TaxID=392032 RepID=A0A817ZBP2_9BILA|nr:unnamed protein product [Rotaria socialis]
MILLEKVSTSAIINGTKTNTVLNSSVPHVKQPIQHLQNIIASIRIFPDSEQFIDFLSDIKDEEVFLIVTGSLGHHLVSGIKIHTWVQLNFIYVLDDKLATQEQWAQTTWKVKGVYAQLESVCETLKIKLRHCDRSMVSMNFSGIDPLCMYTQLLKESLLEIEDNDEKSIKEFVDYCRLQSDILEQDINKTNGCRHLHYDIEALYREQQKPRPQGGDWTVELPTLELHKNKILFE